MLRDVYIGTEPVRGPYDLVCEHASELECSDSPFQIVGPHGSAVSIKEAQLWQDVFRAPSKCRPQLLKARPCWVGNRLLVGIRLQHLPVGGVQKMGSVLIFLWRFMDMAESQLGPAALVMALGSLVGLRSLAGQMVQWPKCSN